MTTIKGNAQIGRRHAAHGALCPGQSVIAYGAPATVAFIDAVGRAFGYTRGSGIPVALGNASPDDPCGIEGAERQLELGCTAKLAKLTSSLASGELEAGSSVVTPFRPTWGHSRSARRTAALTPLVA